MQPLSLTDTVVAISSAWRAAPLGIIRLSGPDAFEIAGTLGPRPRVTHGRPRFTREVLHFEDLSVPADVLWFFEPRSYTGQPLVELHTIGSLPLLRRLSERLLEAGARRATAGEFTSRAFVNGRLDADGVRDVLARIESRDAAQLRSATRRGGIERHRQRAALETEILELLALVEAGIDFVEEEHVQFLTPSEAATRIDQLLSQMESLVSAGRSRDAADKPHIALAGLPNAGKSTLFNALVGRQRAIVSPIIGTTRDVVSAEIELGTRTVVLQDCAGLGASADEIELAAHIQAERAADRADLVLWVHRCDAPWTLPEHHAFERIEPPRRLLVISQCDRPRADDAERVVARAEVQTSVVASRGLERLRRAIEAWLESFAESPYHDEWVAARASLVSAYKFVNLEADPSEFSSAELFADELRCALERMGNIGRTEAPDAVLGMIFTRFCVGK